MIDTYLLEQLLAVYKYGTLSAAADAIHLSQPTLSRSMRKLEDEIGVPLFIHGKNKIVLNETGCLVAEYRIKIKQLETDMLNHARKLSRINNSIVWGSCARTPYVELGKILSSVYNDKEIVCEIESENKLISELLADNYIFIVLTHPLDDRSLINVQWKTENLYITLPKKHHLSGCNEIRLSQLSGENILLYSNLGFWQDMLKSKIPQAHFVIHNEYEILNNLIRSSDWPIFQTNFTIGSRPEISDRLNIPVTDAEANVTYYCIYKKQNKKLLSEFIKKL